MHFEDTDPLGDAHVTISGDQYTTEFVMDRITALPQFKATYIDVLELDEKSSRLSVAVSLLNLISDACIDCDHYDHSAEDAATRCAKGVECLCRCAIGTAPKSHRELSTDGNWN
jgi:hypothetical protein